MKRLILSYGIIAGLVIIVTNIVSMELGRGQAWLGFLVMFIAFSVIYVAVKRYRDEALGGVISFMTALLVGLGISAVAGIVYVGIWELYLFLTDYEFIDSYATSIMHAKEVAGATQTELARLASEAERFRASYSKPLYRLPVTFVEVFPPGFLVSLASAAVLRNYGDAG